MLKVKLMSGSALVLALALVIGISAPAFAHLEGHSETKTEATRQAKQSAEQARKEQQEQQKAKQRESQATKQAELVAKKAEQKKQNCQSRKQGLATKFSRITANSQRIQTGIDSIYAKALAYRTAHNLQPAGFDDLVAAANAAQAASVDSIAALGTATPSVDCNSASVASDVAAFKAAAQNARDNLKTYRTAVKAVLQSLRTVKATTEGSN